MPKLYPSALRNAFLTLITLLFSITFALAAPKKPSFGQAPSIGTTSFDGGNGTSMSFGNAQTSPFTVTNVLTTGWDVTAISTGTTVSLLATGSAGYLGGNDNRYIRAQRATASGSITEMDFASDDGSAFNLQSLAVSANLFVATDQVKVVLTGYRNGTQVGSPVTVTVGTSNGGVLWVLATTNFSGIDEVKIVFSDNNDASVAVSAAGVDALTLTAPAISVVNPTLSNGQAGVAYTNENFSGTGGTAPYSFAIVSGSLPAGMSLSSTGTLSGTPTAVGTFNFSVQTTDAVGHTSSADAVSLTITPPNLGLTPTSLNDGVYKSAYSNVTFTASGGVAPYTYSYTGLPPGMTINASSGVLSGTPTAAGTFSVAVTATDHTTGTGSPYQVTDFMTLVIDKVPLTITPNSTTKIYGAAIPVFTVTYSGFVGGDNSGSLTTQPTIATTATASSPVGTYSITASSVVDPNYSISYGTGATLTVTPASLTITPDNKSMPYGGPIPTFTASYSGFVNSDNASKLTTQPTISSTATATSIPGTYPISATGAVDPNYTISYSPGTLTVNKGTVTITANNASMTYGGTVPALSVTYSGFVGSDNAATLTTQPTINTSASSASNVGTYPITVSGAAAANYNFTYIAGNLIIGPATVTVTSNNASMPYGGPVPALSVAYSGFVNGQTSSILTTTPTVTTTATANSPAGNYPITASGAVAPNYAFAYNPGTLTVGQAVLTITANSVTMVYGGAFPAFGVTYSGFKNGDNANSLTTQPAISIGATPSSPVGVYACTPQGAVDPNYTFNFVPGTLTITPAALTIQAGSANMTYGGAVPALSATYSGFVNGDNVGSLATLPTLSTTASSSSPVGTYPITAANAVDPNYTITYLPGVMTVGPAPLTVTADDKSMPLGGPLPAFTVSYSGFKNGDNVGTLTTPSTASTTATAGSPSGTYSIIPTGGSDPNYTFSYVAGTLTVEKAILTITANNASSVYGSPLVPTGSLTLSYSGFINGDNAGSLTVPPVIINTAFTGAPVGTYALIPSGAVDPNYTIVYANGNYNITPASLTIQANNASMTYGGTLPPLTLSYNGFVNGDAAANLTIGPVLTTPAISTSPAGTYPITASGAIDPNYTITYTAGALTIAPAALSVTANAQTKVYGTPDPTLTYTASGLLNNDNSSVFSGGLARNQGEDVGTYPITQGTLSAGNNYVLNFTGNNLTITKAPQQITWTQSLLSGCNGVTQFTLTGSVSSGLPITYSSSNPAVASVTGDILTLIGPGTSIITATQAGDANHLAAPAVTDTVIEQSQALVSQHWSDVLFFDNSSNDYVQWQWYKNGAEIQGATNSYYSEEPSLSGQYYVIATNNTGQQIQSCPLTITPGATIPGGIKVFPNPVINGIAVNVVCNYSATDLQGAQMQIVDITGKVRQVITNVQPSMQVTMPSGSGIYIINLLLTNGQKASVNVLVAP